MIKATCFFFLQSSVVVIVGSVFSRFMPSECEVNTLILISADIEVTLKFPSAHFLCDA